MEEHYRIIKYKPNVPGNIVIGGLYAIQSFVFMYYIIRHKDKWALCLPLGAIASSIGFFLRLSLDPENVSLILYVLQSMFIIATPSAFLAFNYMLYGRLLTAIDLQFGSDKSHSKMEKSRYSCIPPQIVGRVFIISDITTFLIQVAAGGMLGAAGGSNPSLAKFGDTLYLVGVCAQGACYFLFTVLLTVTLMRLVAERQRAGTDRFGKSWMGLDHNTLITASALYFSSLFITAMTDIWSAKKSSCFALMQCLLYWLSVSGLLFGPQCLSTRLQLRFEMKRRCITWSPAILDTIFRAAQALL
ncbi:hypothetical protein BGZ88_001802 [Linnemannia elongata]|nr:hypothetical protein BGZ88_001802 [Linnemannia elongata]